MVPPSHDDSDLLTRLRKRDAPTLAAIVQECARPLYRNARGLGFDNQEAEDLVQDVFAVFLETLDRFQGRSQVKTWLFGILHHKIQERRRSLQREELADPIDARFEAMFDASEHWAQDPVDLERLLASQEIGRHLHDCLDSLPLQQREVFLLREMEGMESHEVCNNLQITVTHLGVLIHRARHRLRECLKGKGWRQSA